MRQEFFNEYVKSCWAFYAVLCIPVHGLCLSKLSFASKESWIITALLLECIQSVSKLFKGGPGVSFSAYKVSFPFKDKQIHLIR